MRRRFAALLATVGLIAGLSAGASPAQAHWSCSHNPQYVWDGQSYHRFVTSITSNGIHKHLVRHATGGSNPFFFDDWLVCNAV